MELHAAKAGEADQSRFTAQDETGKPATPGEAIVPILKQIQGNKWQLIGTGFFITVNGLVATAKHVLMDVLDNTGTQTHPIAIFQFLSNDIFIIRPLLRCVVNNASDVAIGVAAPMNHRVTGESLRNRSLILSTRALSKGEPVFTYAYPNTVHEYGAPQAIYFNPRYYEGRVCEFFPEGRDKVFLPNPCYPTSIAIHGGASGGPVFDAYGRVCGINSTGFAGCPDISFISRVHELLPLTVTDIKLSEAAPPGEVSIQRLVELGHVSADP